MNLQKIVTIIDKYIGGAIQTHNKNLQTYSPGLCELAKQDAQTVLVMANDSTVQAFKNLAGISFYHYFTGETYAQTNIYGERALAKATTNMALFVFVDKVNSQYIDLHTLTNVITSSFPGEIKITGEGGYAIAVNTVSPNPSLPFGLTANGQYAMLLLTYSLLWNKTSKCVTCTDNC